MSPAAHHLLRALYLHAMAPSTANQDAVRAAGAALDTETGRRLNAPRQRVEPNLDTPVDTVVAEVHADLLARSEVGSAKYGVTLDRRDLGHAQWLQHGYEEALDLACYLKRAMRDVTDDHEEPPTASRHDAEDAIEAGCHAASGREAEWGAREQRIALTAAREAVYNFLERVTAGTTATAPVEPPHGAALVLATLTPEPAEAVLGRAGEALAGSLPVYVLAGTGRHPYGDDAWHMETDGVARLFPSKEAAQRWLAAMGKAPV